MLLLDRDTIDEIDITELQKKEYCPVLEEDFWKVTLAKELIDIRSGDATVENFSKEEIESILTDICVN